MNAMTLLDTLQTRGVVLTLNGDKIAYEAPAGVVDSGVLNELRRLKPELLELLSQPIAGNAGTENECSTAPREFAVRDAYCPVEAAHYAAKEFRAGRINREQLDALLQYATDALPALAPRVDSPSLSSTPALKAQGGAQ